MSNSVNLDIKVNREQLDDTIEELKDTDIHVAYGIDKGAESIYAEIDIVSPDDNLQEVDVIVVTAITFFEDIEEKLSKKVNCPIVSLEDILYEL